ncbi:hypothetical protein MUJ63_11360 [Lachnospiraceae bacterium NSJ-143]|nr:hypothetical protein [Lachnospiraceae bacterium NSJ-143]
MTNATKQTIGLGATFSVASVWFTTHAGAGFATGNQAWQYYAVYGIPGMIFPLISMGLLALVLREIMIMSQVLGTRSYGDVMKYAYKPYDKLYIAFEVFYYCIVLAAVGGVISSAAGMIQEIIPMNTAIATVIVGIVLLVLIIFGADLVRRVATVLGILIIVSGFTIYIIGFVTKLDVLGQTVASGYAPSGWLYPLWQAIVYCGFQCVAIPAMVACCEHLKTKSSINMASFLGFLMNGFGVALTVWMLIGFREGLEAGGASVLKLPTLYVCEQLGIPVLFYFYKICLFCCLISTGVSCIFGLVVRFENVLFKNSTGIMSNIMSRRILISVLCIAVCMGISSFGLTNIVKIGYKYCGYLAIVICVIPFLTIGHKKNVEDLKNGKKGLLID